MQLAVCLRRSFTEKCSLSTLSHLILIHFEPYLKLVFSIVMKDIRIQTNYLQKSIFYTTLAAYIVSAVIDSPIFDSLLESCNCCLISNNITYLGDPEKTSSKGYLFLPITLSLNSGNFQRPCILRLQVTCFFP